MNSRSLPRVSLYSLRSPQTARRPLLSSTTPLTNSTRFTQCRNTSKMAGRVHRVTMFQLPGKDDQAKLLESYKKLRASQEKDGKPYILSMVVGAADEDARSQGYTFVSKTEFASMDDMKYYDSGCKAHDDLKTFVKTLDVKGVLTVYFTPQAVGGTDVQ